jgi:hypothetical protein
MLTLKGRVLVNNKHSHLNGMSGTIEDIVPLTTSPCYEVVLDGDEGMTPFRAFELEELLDNDVPLTPEQEQALHEMARFDLERHPMWSIQTAARHLGSVKRVDDRYVENVSMKKRIDIVLDVMSELHKERA